MAKSIRSKHKRKMRNVKRQFYAKKDMERLKRIAENADKELSDIVTMKSSEDIKDMKIASTSTHEDSEEDLTMDVDKSSKTYDKKTKQDENGHYPPWMHRRAIKKHKKKLVKMKSGKKVGKKIKW